MKTKLKLCKSCSKPFTPYRTTQSACSPRCAMKLVKAKKKTELQKMRKQAGYENDRLRHKADALFQEVNKKLKPYSILSGKPTEVIHHRIRKSESNNLRYYLPNGVPLTDTEHKSIHNRGNSTELDIDAKMGEEWTKDLLEKRSVIVKLTDEYLENIIIIKT